MGQAGKIALIANPASQNGRGAWAAVEAASHLRGRVGADDFQLLLTERPGHAVALASELPAAVRTVVALGGDGIVSEVASGLMARPADERPVLGVVPAGSGNDYAATLSMASSIPAAIDQILAFRTGPADVGRVNGRYFVETLSFGLDAAIALDTMERRVRTGRAGTRLYLESAVDQLFNHLETYGFALGIRDRAAGEGGARASSGARAAGGDGDAGGEGGGIASRAAGGDGEDGVLGAASLAAGKAENAGGAPRLAATGDDAAPASRAAAGEAYLFAVQLGPTYGGHFRITPEAAIDDGLLDLCWATPTLTAPRALAVLLAARVGRHTGNRHIHFERASSLVLDFDREPPGQIDGEPIEGTHFEIECIPGALTVIKGA